MHKKTKAIELALPAKRKITAGMIQARVDSLVKPILDEVTLPRLGDMKWIQTEFSSGSYYSIAEKRTATFNVAALGIQGVFMWYVRPCGGFDETATIHAWGLNRHAAWLDIDLDVVKTKEQGTRGWEETATALRVSETTIDAILQYFKSEYDNSGSGSFRDHFLVPQAIWDHLGNFVIKWHSDNRKRYRRSGSFARAILLEDFVMGIPREKADSIRV